MKVGIQVALRQEAQFLIDHYKLKQVQASLPLFESEDISLIVSGIGPLKAASAVGYFIERSSPNLLINFGIAGHPFLELGSACYACKIEMEPLKAHYPYVFPRLDPSLYYPLKTSSSIQKSYDNNHLLDMEGYGFFDAAMRFLDVEKIAVMKVVSDNASCPVEQFDPQNALRLLENATSSCVSLAQMMLDLHAPKQSFAGPDALFGSLRFSVTEKHKLKSLLKRLYALEKDPETILQKFQDEKNAKKLLQNLETHLMKKAICL